MPTKTSGWKVAREKAIMYFLDEAKKSVDDWGLPKGFKLRLEGIADETRKKG